MKDGKQSEEHEKKSSGESMLKGQMYLVQVSTQMHIVKNLISLIYCETMNLQWPSKLPGTEVDASLTSMQPVTKQA